MSQMIWLIKISKFNQKISCLDCSNFMAVTANETREIATVFCEF